MSEADVQKFIPAVRQFPDLATAALRSPTQWSEPSTLGGELPPVTPFKIELLPDALRAWVNDIAERMQIPADIPAAFTVLALAGCVNRRVVIQPKVHDTTWVKVPNLWGAVIAPPGYLKSPAMNACTQPLEKIEAEWREEYEGEIKGWELNREKSEIKLAAWRDSYKQCEKKGGEEPQRPEGTPEAPVLRRLLVCDSTPEKLLEIMSQNPAGVLMVRDELTGWLATLDRQGRESERTFCLESWAGDKSYTMDRIKRGNIHVPACCLSILGGIQPGRLRSYLADALEDGPANDGLIQRFQILVWPDVSRKWELVDRPPDREAESRAAAVFKTLAALSADEPLRLGFSAEAQDLFFDWLTELESKVRGNELHPALVSHLSKYRSLMPSLALLFQLADWAVGRGDKQAVSLDHARQAAAWCDYLENHARRVYACIVTPELRAAQTLGEKIKGGALKDGFTAREVYFKGWQGLNSPERATQALDVLEDAGWVTPEPSTTGAQGGRPSILYRINPKVGL